MLTFSVFAVKRFCYCKISSEVQNQSSTGSCSRISGANETGSLLWTLTWYCYFFSLEIPFAVFSLIWTSLELRWCRDFPVHQLSISPVNFLSCSEAVVEAVGALITSGTAKFPTKANLDPLFYLPHLTLGMKEVGVSGGCMRWRDLALWNSSKTVPPLSLHAGMQKISYF